MKQKISAYYFGCKLFLIVFLCSVFYSCHKNDISSQIPDKRNYTEKFLDKPSVVSAETETIIALLKRENDKTGFIEKLPENTGLPVWDKMIKETPKPDRNEGARGIISDKNGNFLIPLSIDKVTISALLFALYQDGKYNFYCYTNDYAYKVCNNTDHSVEQREKVLALFIYMSNYVYGISEFQNIPNDLFLDVRGKEDGPFHKFLFLQPVKEPESVPETTYVENLRFVEVCFKAWLPPMGAYEGCNCPDPTPETCDWCERCTKTKCFSDWIDEPSLDGGGIAAPPLPPPSVPVSGGNSPVSPSSPPCPGVAWYAKVPFTGGVGSEGGTPQNCDPVYIISCEPDGVIANGICYNSSNYPGKENGFPFKWWLDENWIKENFSFNVDETVPVQKLTKDEIALTILYPYEANIVRINAARAREETISRYGSDQQNRKSNAFKHTCWMVLNAKDIGKGFAKTFGDAHESEVAPEKELEKLMDLHNNSVGYNLYSPGETEAEVIQNSYNAVIFGVCKYLYPLNANGTIGPNTQLIPTDQP